ncbi:MAG TPA: PIG-L family deacetylase [Sedimentisphaerales bacterium]|nr:PIG-L family deacetylase [Sedimentisphaerales bacterium]
MAAISGKNVLSLGAHPDDAEFLCAGTLALLRQKGWQIHIATMAPGDCGTVQYSREEISRIRRAEAAKSASLLDGAYHCLECGDIFILYDRPSLLKAIELVRKVKPAIVFTTSPSDYMVDHEMASKLAQTACFACGVVNVETPGAEPFEPIPHLYYMDAVEHKDNFGAEVKPGMIVDTSSVMDTKEKMLCCHESQRHWLMTHHGMDEYVSMMKRADQKRGREIGSAFAEGFRQHLGHAYPQDNILKAELGELVHAL